MTIKLIYSDLLFCFNKRPVSSFLSRPTEPTQTENTRSACKLIIETQQTLQESGSSFLKWFASSPKQTAFNNTAVQLWPSGRTVGLHELERMEIQGRTCQLAPILQGRDMHGLAFQVERNCWQDTVSMSSEGNLFFFFLRPITVFLSLNGSHWKVMRTPQLWSI